MARYAYASGTVMFRSAGHGQTRTGIEAATRGCTFAATKLTSGDAYFQPDADFNVYWRWGVAKRSVVLRCPSTPHAWTDSGEGHAWSYSGACMHAWTFTFSFFALPRGAQQTRCKRLESGLQTCDARMATLPR